MIAPIWIDLTMALCAVILGLVVMLTRMRVVDDGVYTPILELAVVCAGALSWAIYGFLALSAITMYPPLHPMGYQGHWGYTLARFLSFVMWVLALLLITRYSAYMQVRKKPNNCNKHGAKA